MGVEKRERDSTEEERGNSSSSTRNLDTGRAEAPVWLMKCPVVVAKSWSSHNPSDPHPIAKVVLSFDPLRADDPTAMEFKMEMPDSAAANLPKSYSLNMFKDFVPMCVFSETNQGWYLGFRRLRSQIYAGLRLLHIRKMEKIESWLVEIDWF